MIDSAVRGLDPRTPGRPHGTFRAARAFVRWHERRPPMSIEQADIVQLQHAVGQSIHDHWVFYMVEGVILVVLGLAAILIPQMASLAVAILIGWLFLISGMVGLFTTFWLRHAPGFSWSLVSALLAIAAGIVLLGWPVSGVLSL